MASSTAVPALLERSSSLSISSFLSANANLFTLARVANLPIDEVLAWFNASETQSQLQAINTAHAQCAELQPALDDRLKQSALETLDDIHRDPKIDPAIRCRAATTILRALRPATRHVSELGNRTGASPQASTNGTSGAAPKAPARFRNYSRLRPLDPLDTTPIPTGPLPILPSVDPNITHAINDRLKELTCHERDNTRDAPESLRTASHAYEIIASMDTPLEPALRILHALCAPEARINAQQIPREAADFVKLATAEPWPMPGRVGAARPQEQMLLTDTLIGADFAAEHIPARENLGGAHRHTFTLDREQYNTLVEVTFTPQHSGHHAITSINYHKCWTPDTS